MFNNPRGHKRKWLLNYKQSCSVQRWSRNWQSSRQGGICPVLGDWLSAPTSTLSIWRVWGYENQLVLSGTAVSITSLPFFLWKTLVATAIQEWADQWSNLRPIVNNEDSFWRTRQTSPPERIMVLNGSILPEYQQIRSPLRLWRIVWSVQTPGSRLAVSLSPFGEFSARYTPTGANFESRQFFAVDHSQYGVGRQIQQFSGLAWTQEWSRIRLVLHGQCCKPRSQQ